MEQVQSSEVIKVLDELSPWIVLMSDTGVQGVSGMEGAEEGESGVVFVDGYYQYTCSRWGDNTRSKVPVFFYPTANGNHKRRKEKKRDQGQPEDNVSKERKRGRRWTRVSEREGERQREWEREKPTNGIRARTVYLGTRYVA